MDITFAQAAVIADELAAAMVEKGMKLPEAWFHVKSGDSFSAWLRWYGLESSHYPEKCQTIKGQTGIECAENARAWIAALPTPITKALNDHMAGIAKLVDAGRAAGIDDAYIAPLVVVKSAMSANLLAAPVAS